MFNLEYRSAERTRVSGDGRGVCGRGFFRLYTTEDDKSQQQTQMGKDRNSYNEKTVQGPRTVGLTSGCRSN